MSLTVGSLFAPSTTRTVHADCPCGQRHPLEIPARWDSRPRTLWTRCPDSGAHVTLPLEPTRRRPQTQNGPSTGAEGPSHSPTKAHPDPIPKGAHGG